MLLAQDELSRAWQHWQAHGSVTVEDACQGNNVKGLHGSKDFMQLQPDHGLWRRTQVPLQGMMIITHAADDTISTGPEAAVNHSCVVVCDPGRNSTEAPQAAPLNA